MNKKALFAMLYGAFAMGVSTWFVDKTRKKSYGKGVSDGLDMAKLLIDLEVDKAKAVKKEEES